MTITARQVEANPDEAANYIALLLAENARMKAAISSSTISLDRMAADCRSGTRASFREAAEEIAQSLRSAVADR